MYRNIEINYKIDGKKGLLTINYLEENKESFKNIIKEYDLTKYDEQGLIYNQMLDDLDAEYDDCLASLLDKLTTKILKEK